MLISGTIKYETANASLAFSLTVIKLNNGAERTIKQSI